MAVATRTFLQLVQAVADSLDLRESGTLTAASTTALTIGTYPFKTNYSLADNNLYVNNEVYITTASTTTAPNPNGISQYVASTGVLTPSFTYPTAPAGTSTFDIYKRGVGIALIRTAVNEALRKRAYLGYWPMTIIADGDMATSGTTDWTASNSSLSKVSTGGTLVYNTQSLRVLLTADAGYARTASMNAVDPVNYRTYSVQALVSAPVGTARLIAYDVTNSAEIKSEDWAYTGWGYLGFTFDLPATCEQFQIRIGGVLDTANTYWNFVSLLPVGATSVALPDWITETGQVRQVIRTPSDQGPIADRLLGREVMWFKAFPNLGNPNSAMRVDFAPGVTGPMWVHAYKFFPTLSVDADTTFALRSWIELAAQVELLRVLSQRPASENTLYWRSEYERRAKRLRKLDQLYMPPEMVIQMSAPYTANVYNGERG